MEIAPDSRVPGADRTLRQLCPVAIPHSGDEYGLEPSADPADLQRIVDKVMRLPDADSTIHPERIRVCTLPALSAWIAPSGIGREFANGLAAD